jgi:exopolysaccharide production protein ExoY
MREPADNRSLAFVAVDNFDGPLQTALGMTMWAKVKSVIEPLIALLLILLVLPVLLALYVLTRMDGGPALFGHPRVGLRGQEFRCLKFRSMVVDSATQLERHLAENPSARLEWETSHKLRHDPRITRIGRVLRTTSLDELPQLFNVLRGDMSLVGPRPVERSELYRFYQGSEREAYLSVRPGLTGLWQVSGRSDVGYVHRVALDIEYVGNASPLLDMKILCQTVSVVLFQKGAR